MNYLKSKLNNKYLYFLIFLSMFFTQACANTIHEEYKLTVNSYNQAISEQQYEQAYKFSEILLSMDPSDTLSLLRFTYSSKMLNKNDKSIIDEYLHGVERSSVQDPEIISLIMAIQASKN